MYLFVDFNGRYCAILGTLYVDAQKSIGEKHKQKLHIVADSDVEVPAVSDRTTSRRYIKSKYNVIQII